MKGGGWGWGWGGPVILNGECIIHGSVTGRNSSTSTSSNNVVKMYGIFSCQGLKNIHWKK